MKKPFIYATILLSSLLAATPFYAQAATQSSIEGKIALENSLQKRVHQVLSEALGTENIIVIISAELNEKEQNGALDFLPGIPEKEKVGEINFTNSLTLVKKITATIILDTNTSKSDIKLAKKLAGGLLGISPDREDLISIEKMNFKKDKPFTIRDMFTPPNLWNVIWIALIAIFATLTITVFLSPVSKTAGRVAELFAAAKSSEADRDNAPINIGKTAIEEEKQIQTQDNISTEEGKKKPFWFINESNLSNLIFILKSKPTEDLTVIFNYATKEISAKLIEELYPRSLEALKNLPQVVLMPEAEIRKLETDILAKLEYVVGGEDKTLGILETLQEKLQEKAISSFAAANPLFSKKISGSIVKFSDIKNLEPTHAQLLARRVPMRNFAAALKNSDIVDGFVNKLSGGMQERMKQELDLTRSMSYEASKTERLLVIKALKQLIKEGFISLNKTTNGPAARGQAMAGKPAGAPTSFTRENIAKKPFSSAQQPSAGSAPSLKPKPQTPNSAPSNTAGTAKKTVENPMRKNV